MQRARQAERDRRIRATYEPAAFVGPRRVRAAEMRYRGMTYAEIGREMGVSGGRAGDLVRGFVYSVAGYMAESGEPIPGTTWRESMSGRQYPELDGGRAHDQIAWALARYAERVANPPDRPGPVGCPCCGRPY